MVWVGLLTWLLRRIRIWWHRQFLSNREHWTWTGWHKRIEFRWNCPRPGLPTQGKFKTKIQPNWPMLGLNGRLSGSDRRIPTYFFSYFETVIDHVGFFRGYWLLWNRLFSKSLFDNLIMELRICYNWQFASTVVTIAIDTTWNIVAMWHHDQQIELIHHDLNKEWIWDLICIIRKSFEIFILFKLKIRYSHNCIIYFLSCILYAAYNGIVEVNIRLIMITFKVKIQGRDASMKQIIKISFS